MRTGLALRGTEGGTAADLRAAFQNRDDHDVGDTDGTHDQCHHPKPEEEAVERPRSSSARGEHVGWLAYVHLVRCLGIGGWPAHQLPGRLITRGSTDVDRSRG